MYVQKPLASLTSGSGSLLNSIEVLKLYLSLPLSLVALVDLPRREPRKTAGTAGRAKTGKGECFPGSIAPLVLLIRSDPLIAITDFDDC